MSIELDPTIMVLGTYEERGMVIPHVEAQQMLGFGVLLHWFSPDIPDKANLLKLRTIYDQLHDPDLPIEQLHQTPDIYNSRDGLNIRQHFDNPNHIIKVARAEEVDVTIGVSSNGEPYL